MRGNELKKEGVSLPGGYTVSKNPIKDGGVMGKPLGMCRALGWSYCGAGCREPQAGHEFHGFIIGTLAIVAGLLIIVKQPIVFDWFLPIAERYLSHDHHISHQQNLRITIYFVGIFCLLIGGFSYACTQAHLRFAVKQAFLTDAACKSGSTILRPINVLITSSAIGLILTILYWVIRSSPPGVSLYREDGFFETLTAINFLLAAVIMGRATFLHWRKNDAYISVSYLFIALVCFLFGMEEISWGQRIIGWETPLFLAEINLQHESNLHNIVSLSEQATIRGLLAVSFFLVLVIGWLLLGRFWPIVYNYVFPHPSLMVLAVLIAVASTGELCEELTSFFAVFYSVRVWWCHTDKQPLTDPMRGFLPPGPSA